MQNKIILVSILMMAVMLLSACSDLTNVPSKSLPDESSQGAVLLKEYCSGCHGAPHPTDHVASHWPNVIARMQTHRIREAYNPVPDDDKAVILSYLQKHAAQ